jgi:hypothetical protein
VSNNNARKGMDGWDLFALFGQVSSYKKKLKHKPCALGAVVDKAIDVLEQKRNTTHKMALTEEAARAKISKFLKPIVQEWMSHKRGETDENGYITMNYVGMCDACSNDTLGAEYCFSCRKMKKEDPKGFADMAMVCDKCWEKTEYYGCPNCCDEEDQRRSCHVCGASCDGSDWAWTGHCSRWCATSYDRKERGRGDW